MGIKIMRISGQATTPVVLGEPQPHNFSIIKSVRYNNNWCVVWLNYPDCKNFEGNKILVYESWEKFTALEKKGIIDPHFLEKNFSPFARFQPTEEGWKSAQQFAQNQPKK